MGEGLYYYDDDGKNSSQLKGEGGAGGLTDRYLLISSHLYQFDDILYII